MINSDIPSLPDAEPHPAVAAATGPPARGALVLAGIAVLVVLGIWFAFYLFVFLPRGSP